MDLFDCPLPTALTIIPDADCPVKFDQIQRVVFQRKQTTSSFTTSTILTKSTWDALLNADDDTRAVISPYLNNFVIGKGDVLKEGGNDNTTLNGVPRLLGLGFAPGTAELHNVTSEMADAMRSYTSESAQNGFTNLWAYFINKDGKIIGKLNEDGTHVDGFDMYNLVVPDVTSEGFAKDNIYFLEWSMAGGWSEGWQMYKGTDFNALNLINQPGS